MYQVCILSTHPSTDYSQATLQEAAWGIPGLCCVHTEATMSSEAPVLPDPVLMRVSDVQIHGVEVQRYLQAEEGPQEKGSFRVLDHQLHTSNTMRK